MGLPSLGNWGHWLSEKYIPGSLHYVGFRNWKKPGYAKLEYIETKYTLQTYWPIAYLIEVKLKNRLSGNHVGGYRVNGWDTPTKQCEHYWHRCSKQSKKIFGISYNLFSEEVQIPFFHINKIEGTSILKLTELYQVPKVSKKLSKKSVKKSVKKNCKTIV